MEDYRDFSSYFIENRGLFGTYPTQERVEILKSMGVQYFVDLTVPGEVYPTYTTGDALYANFPILDRKAPGDIAYFTGFALQIYRVIKSLQSGEKVYIHCKGGHGRAGVLVAIMLYLYLGNISTQRALALTSEAHDRRLVMRQKWRDMGSPQTRSQKSYVHRFFTQLVFYRAYRKGPSHGFSSYSFHNVTIPPGHPLVPAGTFPSSEAVFQASKQKDNPEYVQKHTQAKNPRISRKLGERIKVNNQWLVDRYEIMRHIVTVKLAQNKDVMDNLLNTGLRPIFFNSRVDPYFGTGRGEGQNHLGKILMDIRNEYHRKHEAVFSHRRSSEVLVPV